MKLSILQRRLLASAAARSDGQMFPLAARLAVKGRDNAIQLLLDATLLVIAPAKKDDQVWRVEGTRMFGLIITQAGRDLISAEEDGVSLEALPAPEQSTVAVDTQAGSKISQVLGLLHREEGADLGEIGQATGWLPHSVRAAITGLRKKGHFIERQRRGEVTTYMLKGGL